MAKRIKLPNRYPAPDGSGMPKNYVKRADYMKSPFTKPSIPAKTRKIR
jgi:hypothetical protein